MGSVETSGKQQYPEYLWSCFCPSPPPFHPLYLYPGIWISTLSLYYLTMSHSGCENKFKLSFLTNKWNNSRIFCPVCPSQTFICQWPWGAPAARTVARSGLCCCSYCLHRMQDTKKTRDLKPTQQPNNPLKGQRALLAAVLVVL